MGQEKYRKCTACGRQRNIQEKYGMGWMENVCHDCIEKEQKTLHFGRNEYYVNYYADFPWTPIQGDFCEHVEKGTWEGSFKVRATTFDTDYDWPRCVECLKQEIQQLEEYLAAEAI